MRGHLEGLMCRLGALLVRRYGLAIGVRELAQVEDAASASVHRRGLERAERAQSAGLGQRVRRAAAGRARSPERTAARG